MTNLSMEKRNEIRTLVLPQLNNGFVYSYPPIPIITTFGTSTASELYEELTHSQKPISLFIHIPFCEQICKFCTCTKKIANNNEMVDFMGTIKREISYYQSILEKSSIKSIFFGGGTPSILSVEQLEELFFLIRKSFNITEQTEVTFEIYPSRAESLDLFEKKLEYLGTNEILKVNRVSMGVQAFDEAILNMVGRYLSRDEILKSITSVDRYFSSYNIDLIYGFPNEDVKSDSAMVLKEQLNDLIETLGDLIQKGVGLPSITLYRFWTRSDTATMRQVHRKELILPEIDDIIWAKYFIKESMSKLGYSASSVGTYVRSENYSAEWAEGRWNDYNYVGIGAGTYGFTENYTFTKPKEDIVGYIYNKEGLTSPFSPKSIYKLSASEKMYRYLILGLRMNHGISLNWMRTLADGQEISHDTIAKLDRLHELGFLEKHGENMHLTQEGFVFGDDICEYLYPSELSSQLIEVRDKLYLQNQAKSMRKISGNTKKA